MALESNGVVTTMPLAPSNGGGFGGFGGDGWWIILLFILLCNKESGSNCIAADICL